MTPRDRTKTTILERGTTVAGYRVDGVIGHGGMGVVYEATQLSLKRKIALKLLASHLSEDPRFRERFRREGELQARLDHPHIVSVHEAGESDYGLFLAMRMVRGPRLKDLILARELNAERSVRILSPIGDALDAAHEEGLIHRDVKPQNILVGARDHAFLADFGLTKLPGEKSLTETGQFMGTLDYVAPEQIVGEPATIRTDVYAFGAVLCECLTGVVPFPRENEAAVLYAHLSDPPPRLTERVSELPAGLDEVVARALAKEPAERYESSGELMEDVHEVLGPTRRLRSIKQPEPVVTPPQQAVLERESAPTDEVTDWEGDEERTRRLTDRPRRRPSWRSLAAYAAAASFAGVAGAVAGAATGDAESSERSRESPAVALTMPDGWDERPESIAGLRLRDATGGARGDRGIVAGLVAHPGVTLLPRELEARTADGGRPDSEPVTIAGMDARRHSGLAVRGSDSPLTVFSIPTSEGVIAVACYAPAESPAVDECGAAAGSLEIKRGKPLSLTPDPEYGTTVDGVMGSVQRSRRLLRQRLGKAQTRYEQQDAAGGVHTLFRQAQRKLDRVRPPAAAQAAHKQLVSALEDAGAAYRRLQKEALAVNPAGYDRAEQLIKDREARIQGALDALKPLGYTIQ